MTREIVELLKSFRSLSSDNKVTVSAGAAANAILTNTPFELAMACLEIINFSHVDTPGLRHLANAVNAILSQRFEELTWEQAEKLVAGTKTALRDLEHANLMISDVVSRLRTGLMIANHNRDSRLRMGELHPREELRRHGLNFLQLRDPPPQRRAPCPRNVFY